MKIKKAIRISLFLFLCFQSMNIQAQCCNYTLSMHDTYGDGWNGATLEVVINNISVGIFSAANTGSVVNLPVCNGDSLALIYTAGMYEDENSYELQDASWNIVFLDGPTPNTGLVTSLIGNCNTLPVQGSHPCVAIPIDTVQCILANNTGFQNSGFVPNCGSFSGGDIWFAMQVPPSGNVSVETKIGSIDDTGIAVWTDNTCSNLNLIDCDDDGGSGYLSFLQLYDLTPGTTIYIQCWKWGGGFGTFEVCVEDIGTIAFDSSELPIVMINTLGQTIVAETKINCLMDIKYNGAGNITYLTDNPNIYSGNIGIENRGQSSSSFAQKPYGFETRTPSGANNNVALLGMPAENDWVLLSNYNDRSLMRNMISYKLFGEMGNYTPRAQLCEVMIDSSYKGIYLLGEKIKQDANRVNIAKLTTSDISGDDLTGGYILQQNYWDADNSFQSNYSPIDHPGFDVHFIYEYPDKNAILPVQKTYIAAFVDSLETALYSPDFSNPISGYRKYLDVKSFIDYFLVNELARNLDGFKKSVFYHKDKNSNGGKLKAGPVWDFDWAYKNYPHCGELFSRRDGSGWAHHINDCFTDNYSTGWYIRLLQDSTFTEELRCTYEDYRQTILDTAYIFSYIENTRGLVQNAQTRHFKKWNLLGKAGFDGEIEPVAADYNGEVDTLKSWINKRLEWLDVNIPGLCTATTTSEIVSSEKLNGYPNPANDYFIIDYSVSSPVNVSVHLYNYLGSEVLFINEGVQNKGEYSLNIKTEQLSPGVYILILERGRAVTTQKIIIIK
jgi:hypothetical protein